MASTPRAFNSGISAFTVPASSRNSRSATPAGETRPGVPFSVRPMKATGSAKAAALLADWDASVAKFVKVMPTDYARALRQLAAERAEAELEAAE